MLDDENMFKSLGRNYNNILVERGKSNLNSKTIDLGKEWTDNRGLFYK